MRKSEHPSDSEISEGTENEHQQLLEPDQPVLGFKKFGLRLSHGYSPVNAIVYLFGVFLTISIFVFLNSTQGFVLKDILEVPTSELGSTSGTLVFYDELTSLFVVVLWGVISDLVGKYLVFGFGFTILSLAVGLFTFSSTVYPELLAYRILYALGGAAASAMLTAILADIAYEKDKSKFAGLVGLSSGLGALLGVFVFLPLPTRFSNSVNGLRSTYFIVAGIAIFGAVLFYSTAVSLLMKREASPENIRNSQPHAAPQSTWNKLFTSVKDGIKAAKNPTIFLGYAGNFLARSDSVSITLFLPLWVYRFYLDNGLCSGFDLNDPSLAREACRGAYTRASILSGVTQVFALIGAPVFAVLTASVLAAIGYLLLGLSQSPNSVINFLYLFLIGFGEIGLIVTSLGLVTHSSVPQHCRGSVAGFASLFGAAGILVCSKFGGFLFDSWYSGGAFMLLAIIHFVFIGVGFFLILLEAARRENGISWASFMELHGEFQQQSTPD